MAAKVKYPVRAALARFSAITKHLDNMQEYLAQADRKGAFSEKFVECSCDKFYEIRNSLGDLEEIVKPLREK